MQPSASAVLLSRSVEYCGVVATPELCINFDATFPNLQLANLMVDAAESILGQDVESDISLDEDGAHLSIGLNECNSSE
jgi:hypothetical protein